MTMPKAIFLVNLIGEKSFLSPVICIGLGHRGQLALFDELWNLSIVVLLVSA